MRGIGITIFLNKNSDNILPSDNNFPNNFQI